MKDERMCAIWLLIAAITLPTLVVSSHATTHEFYREKTIRIIVGFSPGGGFDIYSRAVARHMSKHIPGKPATVVQNMTGAGSLIAANYIYRIAKPDGLTLGNFSGGLLIGQTLGTQGIQFDALKFEYVGVPQKDSRVCILKKASGITGIEQWMASISAVKLGGIHPSSATDYIPKMLKAVLGLPIHLVSGYQGTSEIRLAAEKGEISGGCWGWDSIKATWGNAIKSGDVNVVLQALSQPHPDLPKVPLAINLAKTDEQRQLIQVGIHD